MWPSDATLRRRTLMQCWRDQTWLCVYCWCETPEGVLSPCRAIMRAQPEWSPRGETTIHTQSCCHVTTLSWWQVSQLPPPRSRKCACAGDWACEIELRQTGVICFLWRQRCWSCGMNCRCTLYNENGEFYTTLIYLCFSRSVRFSMGSPAWWRFGLCSSGSSLVSRWRARISNATSQM